jgi:hypothetical protein
MSKPWGSAVRLIDILLHPYVRRLVVSMNILQLPWIEHHDRQVLGGFEHRTLCHLIAPPTGVTREPKLQEERIHV